MSTGAYTVRSLLPGGKRSALVTVEGEALDHSSLGREVDRLGELLRAAGLGPNDRVVIVLPNGPEMALALLAVMSVASAAPLNPKYTSEEFAFYLSDLRPAALLTLEEGSSAVTSVAGDTLRVRVAGMGLRIDFVAHGPTGRVRSGAPSGDDEALVLHTSGTTSRPKIVPLRQRNLACSARNIASSLRLGTDDRSLNVMPLFHIHGIMAGLLAPISAGASVVPTPGFDAFKFGRWLDECRPTYYSAVPTMHHLVLARARPKQPTTLRFIRSSSAALPRPVFDELRGFFGVPVIECYGMTEASHQMTASPLPPGDAKPGSVGLPAGVDVAVVDEKNQPLPPSAAGEVVIRGATVVDGYENNPAANDASFFDGWFRTGDQGYLDEDGYLFLTGRIKEQINRGGEKISPLEVEDVLLGHGSVAEAAAFAIPDERLGEEVGAAVVPRGNPGSPAPTESELREYLRTRIAAFKVPKTILIVNEIPKGATGKVQRIGMAERLGLGSTSWR
jgi:acyl-CoA synthetase (AMP-forming)/AMP-acid ligase II